MVLMRVTKLIAQPSLDPIGPEHETTVKHQKPTDLSQTKSNLFALGETKLQILKTSSDKVLHPGIPFLTVALI